MAPRHSSKHAKSDGRGVKTSKLSNIKLCDTCTSCSLKGPAETQRIVDIAACADQGWYSFLPHSCRSLKYCLRSFSFSFNVPNPMRRGPQTPWSRCWTNMYMQTQIRFNKQDTSREQQWRDLNQASVTTPDSVAAPSPSDLRPAITLSKSSRGLTTLPPELLYDLFDYLLEPHVRMKYRMNLKYMVNVLVYLLKIPPVLVNRLLEIQARKHQAKWVLEYRCPQRTELRSKHPEEQPNAHDMAKSKQCDLVHYTEPEKGKHDHVVHRC